MNHVVHLGMRIELSAGPVDYEDTGGDGPVLVFLHGLVMDASLWAGTIAALSGSYRCIAPTLPLGAHRPGWLPPSASDTRSARTGTRCPSAQICRFPESRGWSPSSSNVSTFGVSRSSATTPAVRSSSC